MTVKKEFQTHFNILLFGKDIGNPKSILARMIIAIQAMDAILESFQFWSICKASRMIFFSEDV